jgi:pimeloyl-ACP methyl ester carboxylesterase
VSTWILLRGLTRESRHWGSFPQLLQTRFPDSGIVTIDLPGAGSLYSQMSPLRIPDFADHCRNQALTHDLKPPYRLLAISLGAMVAVAWGIAHPDEIESIVLVNTSLRPHSPFHHRLRPGSYLALLGLTLSGSPRSREAGILELTSHGVVDRNAIIDEWVAIYREHPVSALNAIRQLLAAARYSAPKRPANAPILVVASKGDALVNPQCSMQLAKAWQTDYAEHPTAGHDLALDDGSWLADTVARWMRQAAGDTPA